MCPFLHVHTYIFVHWTILNTQTYAHTHMRTLYTLPHTHHTHVSTRISMKHTYIYIYRILISRIWFCSKISMMDALTWHALTCIDHIHSHVNWARSGIIETAVSARDQSEGELKHADTIKQWLLTSLGLDGEAFSHGQGTFPEGLAWRCISFAHLAVLKLCMVMWTTFNHFQPFSIPTSNSSQWSTSCLWSPSL